MAQIQISLSWTPPVTRVDGTDLDPIEIASYWLDWSSSDDGASVLVVVSGALMSTQFFIDLEPTDVNPGLVTLDISVTAVDADGRESVPSKVKSGPFLLRPPEPVIAVPSSVSNITGSITCSSDCVLVNGEDEIVAEISIPGYAIVPPSEENILLEVNWDNGTGTGVPAISDGGVFSDVDAGPFEVIAGGPGGINYLRLSDPGAGAYWLDSPPSISNPDLIYVRFWYRIPVGAANVNRHDILIAPTTGNQSGETVAFWHERYGNSSFNVNICPSGCEPFIYTGTLTQGTWYRIEYKIDQTAGTLECRLDGNDITSSMEFNGNVLSDWTGVFPSLNYFKIDVYDRPGGTDSEEEIAGVKITSGPDWIGVN